MRKQFGGDLFDCLEEAIQVHFFVFAPPHHIFEDEVVVRFGQVPVRHAGELGQALELVYSDLVHWLRAHQALEHLLDPRVYVHFAELGVVRLQNLLELPALRHRLRLVRSFGCAGLRLENGRCLQQSQCVLDHSSLYVFIDLAHYGFHLPAGCLATRVHVE